MKILLLGICLLALLAAARSAPAQTAPGAAGNAQTVHVIVPFLNAGIADSVARIVVNKLVQTGRQPYVVENRPGDDGHFGAEVVAKAQPDGNTLLFAPIVNYAAAVSLNAKLHFDFLADFAPVTLIANAPHVLVAHPSLPAKSVADVIAVAKARPGQIKWASHGKTSLAQLELELFRQLSGIRVTSAPFNNSSAALPELLAGNVDLLFDSIAGTLPHIQSGKLRGIAVASARRSPSLAQLPTVAESGLKGFEANYWYGVLAPDGVGKAVIDRLQRDFAAAANATEVKDRLQHYGIEARASAPGELADIMHSETAKWAKVIKAATGLKRE